MGGDDGFESIRMRLINPCLGGTSDEEVGRDGSAGSCGHFRTVSGLFVDCVGPLSRPRTRVGSCKVSGQRTMRGLYEHITNGTYGYGGFQAVGEIENSCIKGSTTNITIPKTPDCCRSPRVPRKHSDDAEISLYPRIIARLDRQDFRRHRWQCRRVRDPIPFIRYGSRR